MDSDDRCLPQQPSTASGHLWPLGGKTFARLDRALALGGHLGINSNQGASVQSTAFVLAARKLSAPMLPKLHRSRRIICDHRPNTF
jgi:hypothetical protein